MENELTVYQTVIDEIREIIYQGTMNAYQAINTAQVLTYWNIGRQIVEEEQHGENRAEYGIRLIEAVAQQLTKEFGASYSKRNLQYYRKFYLCFPDLEIVNTRVHNLTVNPGPYELADLIGQEYLNILVGEDSLISADPADIYLTLYNPDDRMLALTEKLATAEGLFVRKGT